MNTKENPMFKIVHGICTMRFKKLGTARGFHRMADLFRHSVRPLEGGHNKMAEYSVKYVFMEYPY